MTTTHTPTNEQTYSLYREAAQAVDAHGREHGWPVAAEVWAEYERAQHALHATVAPAIRAAVIGDTIWTADGGSMTVADVNTITVLLTADGGAYSSAWHEGPSETEVYVERYTLDGRREFHGYCDATTRRLTQTG